MRDHRDISATSPRKAHIAMTKHIRRGLVTAGLALALTATPQLAQAQPRPIPPEDPLTNSAGGYVAPGDPNYTCTYQRLGSYSGEWCTYTPGKGKPSKLVHMRSGPVWWNPWTWF